MCLLNRHINRLTPSSFSFFSNHLQNKTVGFSGIQTRIVREVGEHADHLTTTAALLIDNFNNLNLLRASFWPHEIAYKRCPGAKTRLKTVHFAFILAQGVRLVIFVSRVTVLGRTFEKHSHWFFFIPTYNKQKDFGFDSKL